MIAKEKKDNVINKGHQMKKEVATNRDSSTSKKFTGIKCEYLKSNNVKSQYNSRAEETKVKVKEK